MQGPTERHLLRRQRYFLYLLEDLVFQAYQRAVQVGARATRLNPPPNRERIWGAGGTQDYTHLFTAVVPEISRWDNESLAHAAHDLAQAMALASERLPGRSATFDALALEVLWHALPVSPSRLR